MPSSTPHIPHTSATPAAPGDGIHPDHMPGHWVLARLGKRVLRPGGRELTNKMLKGLAITADDLVIEFAPGMGHTAKVTLAQNPRTYTAVERDPAAADLIRSWLGDTHDNRRIVTGCAQDTGLENQSATKVYGEAMLTMQPQNTRVQIVAEAFRLLTPGGCYGIHELGLNIPAGEKQNSGPIRKQVTQAIHHQAFPLPIHEWVELLESQGFVVEQQFTNPMALLDPMRIIADEGFFGALRFGWNLLTHGPERKRVMQMRKTFSQLRPNLTAISLIARKPA